MVDVLVAAKSNRVQFLMDYFNSEKAYKVVGLASDLERLISAVTIYKKVIVVIDCTEEVDECFCMEVLPVLREKERKALAICDNVKQGFSLLSMGADDICIKPKSNSDIDRRAFLSGMNMKISKLVKEYDKNPRMLKNKYLKPVNSMIAIGSSTGGTECILKILKAMPPDAPPILVVQHMPPVFTGLYSQRLDNECKISVWEAKDNDKLENGLALIAPGDKQMRLQYKNGVYSVKCTAEEPIGGHMPAVDVLFESIAQLAPKNTIGIILTGMGKDGAKGLLAMRNAGAYTLGQDEESCIVYGMPKVAYDIGAVMKQGSPDTIINTVLSRI